MWWSLPTVAWWAGDPTWGCSSCSGLTWADVTPGSDHVTIHCDQSCHWCCYLHWTLCYHCQLCLPFPNAINLNDTQIDSISIFKHQLKYFKAANQIDDASDKLAADLIERLCLCVAITEARLLRTGHAFRESKPLTGGCELCVINCKYFCPNN